MCLSSHLQLRNDESGCAPLMKTFKTGAPQFIARKQVQDLRLTSLSDLSSERSIHTAPAGTGLGFMKGHEGNAPILATASETRVRRVFFNLGLLLLKDSPAACDYVFVPELT